MEVVLSGFDALMLMVYQGFNHLAEVVLSGFDALMLTAFLALCYDRMAING